MFVLGLNNVKLILTFYVNQYLLQNIYIFFFVSGFIGYASDIYNFITARVLESNKTDDQLFYTKLFLDNQLREKHRVKLDYKSNIFQNLYDAIGKQLFILSTLLIKTIIFMRINFIIILELYKF